MDNIYYHFCNRIWNYIIMKENEILSRFNTNATEHQNLMETLKEFGDTLKKVEISIAELPQKILDRTDGKYASKLLEEDVKDLKEKAEQRNYDWLKYFIITSITALLTYFGLK